MSKKLPGFDYLFLFSVLALVSIGTMMIFSASPTLGIKLDDAFYFVKRHLFFLLLGFGALYFGFNIDLENLRKKANIIFIVSIILLLLVYIPGVGRNISGASRWIDLGFITLQPSELIKFTIILLLANQFCQMKEKIQDLMKGIVPILALIGFVALLIMSQPDLGTTLVIAATSFALLFLAGAQRKHLAALAAMGIAGVTAISIASPYRLKRLLAYLDPWKDPQGIGFQIIQSLLAVGSGGFWGLGLGASRQKYFYLPQQFTDFIFAILCEELGFVGATGVIILFIFFAVRGFRIALSTNNYFHFLLASGITFWITLQAMINIMVVVGLIPTTGIPLPFISFGGTATIINLFAVGVILKISKKSQIKAA
ncbi:MAG: putative lipid II flippase FtsW [Candidatus Margulisiibacteriota bacterium]